MSTPKHTTNQPVEETADQAYQRLRDEFATEIAKIVRVFQRHATAQKGDPTNWGYVGDLGQAVDKLKQINNPEA